MNFDENKPKRFDILNIPVDLKGFDRRRYINVTLSAFDIEFEVEYDMKEGELNLKDRNGKWLYWLTVNYNLWTELAVVEQELRERLKDGHWKRNALKKAGTNLDLF